MASDLELSLKRIGEKSRILAERYKTIAAQRDQAINTIAELKSTLAERVKEIEQLKIQLEYLTIASTIAPNRENLDKARATISEIVRDIDRCIADLAE